VVRPPSSLMTSPTRTVRLTSIALSLLGFCNAADAQCVVVPGVEGEVSTLLVRSGGRVARIAARPTLRAALGAALDRAVASVPAVDASGWRADSSDDASLDLGRVVGGRGPRAAHAAIRAVVASAGDRWLFVGSDDAVAVRVDGREVYRSVIPRRSRADDDMVRVSLTPGTHTLSFTTVARGGLDLFVRLTGPDFRPDPSVALSLPGVDDAACEALAARSLRATFARAATPDGTRVDAHVAFPGGTAAPASRARAVSLGAPDVASVDAPLSFAGGSAQPLDAAIVLPPSGSRVVTLRVDGATRSARVFVDPAVRAALLDATAALAPLDPSFGVSPSPWPLTPVAETRELPAAAIFSVEATALRLAALVSAGDPDLAHLREEAATLTSLLGPLRAGRDPYVGRTGAMHRAWRSPLDATLQEFSLYVPPRYRPTERMPLVVGLHGLHGGAHRMLPVLVGLYDESENRTHAERHLPPMPDTAALLLAPYGYGDAGYRQQGEVDVMAAVDAVAASYAVNPDRVYLTGLSMGGIGAAGVAFHHPDRFAAIAPLCGYHSYFVRSDTRTVRRPWEVFLMELRSNASYAENGLHLPMYLVHGTLDRPTANSQVLVDRYAALHYEAEVEWPTLGHNVWSQTYADGRIIPHFLQHQRDPAPRHVRFRTPEVRWSRSHWVSVDALLAPGSDDGARLTRTARWGDVDASVDAAGGGRVRTDGVGAMTLTPPAALVRAGVTSLRLDVDGDPVELPVGRATSMRRVGGHWRTAERVTLPGGGPIREVFDTPLLFVVGTGDPRALPLYERAARAWAHRGGVPLRYRIVRDDSYTEAMGAGRTLVLVGTPRDHRLLARMADRLPVRVAADAITVGPRRFEADDAGVVFTAADPDRPDRAVLVISGRSPTAVLRSHSLPDLLPAYVVYDERVAGARGRVLLGPAASVLAAGFFDAEGRTIGDDRDPIGSGGDAVDE
jgi:poly(3-hydroxybutyrate) depolymerase